MAWLRDDLVAGLTVGVMLIPQGMAYALIAGLPPEYGLYASVVPLLIYAMLGTSPHLAVGPVALMALLVASAASTLSNSPEEHIAISILLALMAGVTQLALGLLRMGFLVSLLSRPVLSGFVSAAAIVIGLSQLHHLLGVEAVSGGLHEIVLGVAIQISEINPWTLAIGAAGIVLIQTLKKRAPHVPGSLMAAAAGIVLVAWTGLHEAGVGIVGEIPEGLPSLSMPALDWSAIQMLFPMAAAIALVGYMESIAVAKAIQEKSGDYEVDPNRELIALGAANVGGSLFQSFPVTGGFSRTAVNYDAGARTRLASIFSAAIVALTLLFLTPLFYYLPKAVLAAIILGAVYGLIEVDEFRRLWRLAHYDRYLFLATFAGTLFAGIKEGIVLGVALSVIMLVYRSARPNYTLLGRVPGTSVYRNIQRYETEQEEGVLVLRLGGPLHFANAKHFRENVCERIRNTTHIRRLVLDFSGVNDMDSTGLDELFALTDHLKERGIEIRLAEVRGPIRDFIYKGAGNEREISVHMTIEDAVKD
ncbi:MAG: SulP family inorganic anion transporter [Candidatus Hydrogenedentota bacterium]